MCNNYLRGARVKNRKKRESGQALVEYMLLVSIIVGLMVGFVGKLTGTFDKTTIRLGGKIERQLRTGSAPATIWKK